MIDSLDRDYFGGISREHGSFAIDDCSEGSRFTKLNIHNLNSELDESAFEINELIIAKSGLGKWIQHVGHKYRRITREAKKGALRFANKFGGNVNVSTGTNFGPNNTTPPPSPPSDIKNVPLNRALPPPPPQAPDLANLTRAPIQDLVNHPSPLTPTPTYQPHHYQLPESKPIRFNPPPTNPIVHYPSPQITPPSKEVARTEPESLPPETKNTEAPSETPALQETVHPIRRTEETERIGSIAIASMKTALQATSKPPTLVERVSSGLRETGSALTHLGWRGVSAVVVQIHSLGELFNPTPTLKTHLQASKEGKESKTFQEEWYNDISPKVHQKIDDFFSTNNKEEFDFRNLPPEKQVLETFFASTTALPANVGKTGTLARGEIIREEGVLASGTLTKVHPMHEQGLSRVERVNRTVVSEGAVPPADLKPVQSIDPLQSWVAKSPSEAYIAAKNGGRHADLIPKFSEKPIKEIEKSIRSYEKLIDEHKDKIANPSKYCQDWDNFHPNRKKALIEKVWPTEIQCYTEQKDILKTILDQRQ